MSEEHAREWSRLHGGYAADRSRLVHGWLRVVTPPARVLARSGVPPHVVTAMGLAAAVGAAVAGHAVLAAALVLLSAVLDGIDGAVAVLAGRVTRLGFVVDSVADRLAEMLFVLAIWRAGASPGVAVAAAAAATTFEYARARALAAGFVDIGVVTVGERPMRVAAVVATLVTVAAFPSYGGKAATGGAALVVAVSVIATAQFAVAIRGAMPNASSSPQGRE